MIKERSKEYSGAPSHPTPNMPEHHQESTLQGYHMMDRGASQKNDKERDPMKKI